MTAARKQAESKYEMSSDVNRIRALLVPCSAGRGRLLYGQMSFDFNTHPYVFSSIYLKVYDTPTVLLYACNRQAPFRYALL